MTIVEVVDAHHGFEVVTSRIRTTSLSSWRGWSALSRSS